MQICFASHNHNKIKELRSLVGKNTDILSLDDIGLTEEIEETGTTLKENALIKANYVLNNYRIPCFADDTGLEVAGLNGAPGVFSARFAGEPPNNENNINKLLTLLEGESNRSARFKTVIAFVDNTQEVFFEGKVEGEIINQRRGEKGFGYDAVFLPKDFDRTFAQMNMADKNLISHRGVAVKKLIDFLNEH
jgi:XTP/dITP diphosphohydrolase